MKEVSNYTYQNVEKFIHVAFVLDDKPIVVDPRDIAQ
jgi:hypothetical protein